MDEDASVLTPLQIRDKLIALAGGIIGKQKEQEVRQLLQFRQHRMRNGGVHTSEEIRYVGEYRVFSLKHGHSLWTQPVKFGRQNGVHVSPTVMWDGLVVEEPQSSWKEEAWMEFLAKHVGI